MTEYLWASPGGAYRVPDAFRERFLAEFPGYRIRWSLKDQRWLIEQQCGRGALPPLRIDPHDDSLIRARDGYWLVMAFQPGDRMACPAVVTQFPRQTCDAPVRVPTRRSAEATCPNCRRNGRDGRTMAAYWPFDECLIERLRETDPLRGGIQRARAEADTHNREKLRREAQQAREAVTSLDAVDYRWLAGIPSSSGRRRQLNPGDFL